MSADKLLRAVQSGQIRLEDLNDEGKNELRGYMRSNFPSVMGVTFQEESDHIKSKTGIAPSFDVGDSPLMKQVNSYTPPITKKTQIQNEREESGKWFDEHGLGFVRKNVLDPVAKGLDWLRFDTSPGQFIDRASQATAEAAGQQRLYEPVSTGSKWVDKTADIVGNVAAPFIPIGGVGTSAANLYKDPLAELASLKMASKVTNPTISKMVQEGTKEALVGAPMMAQYNMSRTADSGLSDGLMGGLEGGVGGFLGGAAVGGLGAGLSKLMKKAPIEETPLLSLPEPRQRGNMNTAMTDDVMYGAGKIEPLGLPEPDMLPPTRARIEKKTNPFEQKYNTLMDEAEQAQFTPGREYEELQQLWSSMAEPNDPSFDELLQLAYPKPKSKLTPDSLSKAKELQKQMDVYGVPKPVKSLSDRYNGFVGEVPMPETKVGFKGLQMLDELRVNKADKGRILKSEVNPDEDGLIKLDPEEIFHREIGVDPTEIKDISGFAAQTRDLYRNLERSLGKEVAKRFTQPFDDAKKSNISMQEEWANKLKSEIVDKYGITKGSKLSALVQKFGEQQITLDDLKAAAPNDWRKVVQADNWFRQAYDQLLDQVNATRERIYPNNPEKIVPKRNDYYRHFRELNGLEGLKNLFDTPSAIDPSLVGISEFVKPNSKWASFMQKRGLGPFKNDAVGGFLNYLPSASYATHIDPQVEVWRKLGKSIAEGTENTRNANGLIEYLNHFANDLAGKTNPADRYIQSIIPGGRKTMAALQWLNNRVKANTILGNLGSTLAQTANIPNGIAFAKQHSIRGAGDAMKYLIGKNTPAEESGFLKERFAGAMYRQFNTKWIEQPRRLAEWLMETADRAGTGFVWHSAYRKGVAEGTADPIRYADDAARKLVAGRGVGEVPLLQKAKITQLVAPFQLEVANLWRVMGDFVKAKDFGALVTLFAANYVFNRAVEQAKGSGVTFDPIQAFFEASQEDLSPTQRAGRVAGEIFSNLPGGQAAADSLFPEYGNSYLPPRKELFGDNDPTRFGSGLLAIKGAQDPLYKAVLPFGGNQLKKSIEGIETIMNDGSYKDTSIIPFKGDKDELKYPVEQSPLNKLRLALFGEYAPPEAREYYNEKRRPLSKEQTQQYERAPDKGKFLEDLYKKREVDTLKTGLEKLKKDQDLTEKEKREKMEELMKKLRKATGSE